MRIVVIDGQGGKLGQRLVEGVREKCPQAELYAVGVNSAATERMRKGGALRVSTGENAIAYACRRADILLGPMGIAITDSMMGEISPAIAEAVARSTAKRVLVPMNLCDTYISGTAGISAEALISDAVSRVCALVAEAEKN